jgi:hypothetical protein
VATGVGCGGSSIYSILRARTTPKSFIRVLHLMRGPRWPSEVVALPSLNNGAKNLTLIFKLTF